MTLAPIRRLLAVASPTRAATLLAALAFGAVGSAVALQLAFDFYPCPWCILQRYAYLALGLVLLARAFSGSDRAARSLIWAAGLVALCGAGMAAFQLYVKLVPSASCGRDAVADIVNGLVLARLAPVVFEATGSCIDPIPVNFPLLSLGGFLLLGVVAISHPRLRA